MMSIANGYCSIQVKNVIRDFIKYKQARSLIKGKRITTTDILLKALEKTYSKEMAKFLKYREEDDDD